MFYIYIVVMYYVYKSSTHCRINNISISKMAYGHRQKLNV